MNVECLVRCENCGEVWDIAAAERPAIGVNQAPLLCPVCSFPYNAAFPAQEFRLPISLNDLEHKLSALLAEARASGLYPDVLMRVLGDELAFTAELSKHGHHFHVQVIDLGRYEDDGTAAYHAPASRPYTHRRSRRD